MITRLLCTATVLLSSLAIALPSASAQPTQIFTGPGSAIPDFNENTGNSGVTTSTITVSDAVNIGDLEVFINGFNHTWAGDLIATIRSESTGRSATLFNRINRRQNGEDLGDGDSSNFDGNYVFSSNGASLWTESGNGSSGNGTQTTLDNGFVISPDQTYANVNVSGFDNNIVPGVESPTSFASIFGNQSSLGDWTLTISDNDVEDIGSFASAGIRFTPAVTAIPEPGTVGFMAVAGIGGLFYVRRKKKKAAEESEAVEV